MHPHCFIFHHVHGHQDKQQDRPLTLPERLNIDCDTRAAKLPPPPIGLTITQHPRIPASSPHLCVNHQVVTQHLQHALHNHTTSNTYFEYLQTKFEWTATPATTIQWTIIRNALQKFSSAECRILSKFNHKWLPLQDRYHVHSSSPNNSCPSCQQEPKTPAHFLACTHHEQTHIWKELHDQLQQHQIKNNISTIFYDIMAFGLYQGRQATHNINLHHLPQDIKDLQEKQQSVGWTQIYYGRLPPTWVQALQTHHPQVNAIQYCAKCITLMWKAVLQVWTVQNRHLHPGTYKQEDQRNLEADVYQIFTEAQSDPNLQTLIEHLAPETILAWPTC